MARPLRIEYPDAVYHVTSRGNARSDIFHSDQDREEFLFILDTIGREKGTVLINCSGARGKKSSSEVARKKEKKVARSRWQGSK